MKYITLPKFLNLPLSLAIRQVTYDLQQFKKRGIKLDSGSWFEVDKCKLLSVCMGGAAVFSFYPNKKIGNLLDGRRAFMASLLGISEDVLDRILVTFQAISLGDPRSAYNAWYEDKAVGSVRKGLIRIQKSIPGYLNDSSIEDFDNFIKAMTFIAEQLQEMGL